MAPVIPAFRKALIAFTSPFLLDIVADTTGLWVGPIRRLVVAPVAICMHTQWALNGIRNHGVI